MQLTDKKNIYIVVSQSGSFPSRFLKLFTHAKYNHISISLNKSCNEMYSFGRRYAYYPFYGGFVCESAKHGLFKRFPKTEIVVLEVDTDSEKYEKLSNAIAEMKKNKKNLKYNYFGVFLAYFKREHRFKNKFYCSEFVKYILEEFQIVNKESMVDVLQPIHFLNLPFKQVYNGTLIEYTNQI